MLKSELTDRCEVALFVFQQPTHVFDDFVAACFEESAKILMDLRVVFEYVRTIVGCVNDSVCVRFFVFPRFLRY